MVSFGIKNLFLPNKWSKNISFSSKIKLMFLVLFLVFLMEEFFVLIRYLLDNSGNMVLPENKVKNSESLRVSLILVSLYMTIYEELAFRLPLKFSQINIKISFSLIIGLIVKILAARYFVMKVDTIYLYVIYDIFSIFIGLIFVVFIYGFIGEKIEKIILVNSNLYFFILNLLWVLLHFNNYLFFILSFEFIVLNFFLLALFYSVIRVRNGMIWVVVFHIMYNLFAVLI